MTRLKYVHLKNYCGYRDIEFNFLNNGIINPINIFFGPNGTGKTTLLDSINILANPHRLMSRDNDLMFRKMTFSSNYDTTYSALMQLKGLQKKNELKMHGIFSTEDGDKNVIIENGTVTTNELARTESDCVLKIDSDNPMNMNKFQLVSGDKFSDIFEEMARVIYGCEIYFDKEISSGNSQVNGYFTDFVIKKEDVDVHFKSMSRGEKKIAGLLRSLCDEEANRKYSMYILDNLELHVYFRRHSKIIDMLVKHFPDKQFICTSHSQTMIDYVGKMFGHHCLYDLEIYKEKEREKLNKEKEGSLLNAINLLKK